MFVRYPVVVGVILAMVAFSAALYSQGMSELNVSGFEKKREKVEGGGGVKSPFTPQGAAPEELIAEDLFLTGIAIGSGKSYALISGYVLKEGDSIAGMRVRSIGKDRVVLQYLDKVHTLYLEGGL